MNFSTGFFLTALAPLALVGCGGGVSLGNIGSDGGGGSGTGSSGGSTPGSNNGVDAGTTTTTPPIDCPTSDGCGPAPPIPFSMKCPDGSIDGFTGRCIQQGDKCAWESHTCTTDQCFTTAGPKGYGGADFSPFLKECENPADCAIVPYIVDCCGSTHQAGVGKTGMEAANQCIATLAQSTCDCLLSSSTADDGTVETTASPTPTVSCVANHCRTTYP